VSLAVICRSLWQRPLTSGVRQQLEAFLFFGLMFFLLSTPFAVVLFIVARLLRRFGVSRPLSIALFCVLAVATLSPFVAQMATLFSGFAPIGYFLLSAPFESNGLTGLASEYAAHLQLHLVGSGLVLLLSLVFARKFVL